MHQTHGGAAHPGVVSAIILSQIQTTGGKRRWNTARKGPGTADGTKGQTMLTMIEKLKAAARNRALYVQTRDAIARLPHDLAQDLGLDPADARRIARDAVYSRA